MLYIYIRVMVVDCIHSPEEVASDPRILVMVVAGWMDRRTDQVHYLPASIDLTAGP